MKVTEIRRNTLRRKAATAWKGHHPTTLWLPRSYILLLRVLILTVNEMSDAFIPSTLLRESQIVPLVTRSYVKRAVSIMKDGHGSGDPDDDMEDDDDYDNEGIVTPSSSIGDVSINDDDTEDDDDEDRYLIEDHDDNNDDEYLVTIGTKIPTQNSPKWEMYNDFDQFLNQCTVQSFVFLLRTCRDIHTVQWIENFTKPIIDPFVTSISNTGSGSNNLDPLLLSYHGLGAMNITSFPTWESYYYDLLQQSKQIYIIESYQKHIPTYEIEINPVSLCNRMISVREQIAKEISHDLHIISQMNINSILQPRMGTYDSKGSTGPSRYMLAMDDTMFLDSIQMNDDDGNSIMPSPLRKGNFDLLLLYITQESIHRILNDNSYNEKNMNNRMNTDEVVITLTKDEEQLLSNFYLHRLVTHFTGRQSYGRAYQFLQELLSIRQQSKDISPIVLEDDEDDDDIFDDGDDEEYESDQTHYINTERIVLHILRTRQQIAKEYSVHTSNISNLHVNIRKIQLNLLMQSYNSPNVVGQGIVTSTPSSTTSSTTTTTTDAFTDLNNELQ